MTTAGPGQPGPPARGEGIVAASVGGTAAFTATAVLAAAVPGAAVVALAVAVTLFAGGSAAFVAALVRAAGRSRTEVVHLAGVFFVDGAPPRVRRLLLGSLAVEVVVAVATAAVRPNTSLAFGILAPVWGQGLAGLWGARHGPFPARSLPAGPRRRPGPPRPPAGSR
ncbi:MAG: hypothetical protein ACLGIO_12570 [Acidimicrobiia bacterium]